MDVHSDSDEAHMSRSTTTSVRRLRTLHPRGGDAVRQQSGGRNLAGETTSVFGPLPATMCRACLSADRRAQHSALCDSRAAEALTASEVHLLVADAPSVSVANARDRVANGKLVTVMGQILPEGCRSRDADGETVLNRLAVGVLGSTSAMHVRTHKYRAPAGLWALWTLVPTLTANVPVVALVSWPPKERREALQWLFERADSFDRDGRASDEQPAADDHGAIGAEG